MIRSGSGSTLLGSDAIVIGSLLVPLRPVLNRLESVSLRLRLVLVLWWSFVLRLESAASVRLGWGLVRLRSNNTCLTLRIVSSESALVLLELVSIRLESVSLRLPLVLVLWEYFILRLESAASVRLGSSLIRLRSNTTCLTLRVGSSESALVHLELVSIRSKLACAPGGSVPTRLESVNFDPVVARIRAVLLNPVLTRLRSFRLDPVSIGAGPVSDSLFASP